MTRAPDTTVSSGKEFGRVVGVIGREKFNVKAPSSRHERIEKRSLGLEIRAVLLPQRLAANRDGMQTALCKFSNK